MKMFDFSFYFQTTQQFRSEIKKVDADNYAQVLVLYIKIVYSGLLPRESDSVFCIKKGGL